MADEIARGESMVGRIKRILMTPREEWPRIDAAPMRSSDIVRGWVLPLAAIGPVAALIGSLAFGYHLLGITYRPSVTNAVVTAVISYVLAIVGVFVLAWLINLLAPRFDGRPDSTQAMKVAAFSATASFLAGIFNIIPMLGILGLLGLYSLYLFWVGLPILMKVPADKATGYAVITIVAAIVTYIIVGIIAGAIAGALVPRHAFGGGDLGSVSGEMTVPGLGKVDLGKLDAAAKRMEQANTRAQNATPVPVTQLAAMLPASVGAFAKGDSETSSASAAGYGGSKASAAYQSGDQRFDLSITDMAAAGAFTALGTAFNVESSKNTANGYESTKTIDGRMTTENWHSDSSSGTYGVVVGERFLVQAEGNAPSVDVLKQAVGTIDFGDLEALASH